uniref:Golgi associated, gamma adaptin ear containing, ARF binding protein 3a n=1 Tax=Mastacembelus armatus TaxID=205130 RepID=A0A7N8YK96_9TELE
IAEAEIFVLFLDKATNPSNKHEDWEYIMGFCDQINKELEGPQISVRLLAHKIQSPQEWEAMQALMVLEACMKNCGQRFHSEVGKFKFLNELIKVISPKYFGDKVSEKVKTKVIEMLYSWTLSLPDEAKICEAYRMLKSQGIVLADPQIPFDVSLTPSPSPRPKNPVFDDEKKSKRLAELLKSKKSEDLQEANHLIKNMVKEDEVRTQKAAKQKSTLEAVRNSVKVLNDMLAHFSPEDSTDGDKELIRELYGDCDKLRQTVFQLATEAEDNDSTLGDILQANDDLCHAINLYRKIVEGQTIEGESKVTQQIRSSVRQGTDHTNQSEILIDLVGLDVQNPVPSAQQPPAPSLFFPNGLLSGSAAIDPQSPSPSAPSAACSLLDKELLSLGEDISKWNLRISCLHTVQSQVGAVRHHMCEKTEITLVDSWMIACIALSFQSAPSVTAVVIFRFFHFCFLGKVCPVTAYDKNGVRLLLHFATDCPPGRPDVLVIVASMLNTAPQPVRSLVLQAAVPKTMKVKLQPPSGTELAPFNPVLPPAAITQVMLLANPLKEKVRMRYKLTFTLGEQPFTEVGEVHEFPPADRWGAL